MVSFRRAYEKVSRPGGRWGRRDDVPLELYYEIDDMQDQLEGLRKLVGVSREATAVQAGLPVTAVPDSPPVDEGGENQVQEVRFSATLTPQSSTYAANPRTTFLTPPYPFYFTSIQMTVEVTGGGSATSNPVMFANGNQEFLAAIVSDTFLWDDAQSREVRNWMRSPSKVFAANTRIQWGVNSSSTNARVTVFAQGYTRRTL